MTSPGGPEVGRVSIRVVPNTSRFRDDLRRQLQGLRDVEIPMTPDGEFFQEQVRDQVKRATANNKVEIPVTVDEKSVRQMGQRLQRALDVTNMPDFLNEMTVLDRVMRSVVANAMRMRQSLERVSNTVKDWTRAALNVRQHFQTIVRTVRTLPGHIGLIRFGVIETGIRRSAQALQTLGRNGRSALTGIGRTIVSVGKVLGQGFTAIVKGAGSAFVAIGRILPRLLGSGLKAFGSALKDVGDSLTNIGRSGGRNVAQLVAGLGNAARAAITLGASMAQLGAIATVLVIAGAGITAAWGAAATAIAALPAAIALIGVPLGLLLLDFETLKTRIGELSPAFQQFRKDAAEALAKGLAPALETLANAVLPQVRTNLLGIAETLGQMAQETAKWAATEEGVRLLNDVFAQVNRTLNEMKPGLRDLGIAFLQLAGNAAAFDVLKTAVNTFGAEFRMMVEDLSSGQVPTLDRAFRGLEMVVGSLMRAFVHLVKNGIEVFAAAAPGVSYFIDELTNFFDRFDWERLGKAVGDVFYGLGDALKSVDTSIIEEITRQFEQLGQKFRSAEFQTAIRQFIALIPLALSALGYLVDGFILVMDVVTRVITFIQGAGHAFTGLASLMQGAAQSIIWAWESVKNLVTGQPIDWSALTRDIKPAIDKGLAELGLAGTLMGRAISDWGSQIEPSVTQFGTDLGNNLNQSTEQGLAGVGDQLRQKGTELQGILEQGLGQASQAGQDAFKDLPPSIGAIAGELPGVVKEGLSPVPDEAIGIFQQLEPGVRRAFAGLSIVAFEGMGYIRQSVQDGLGQVRDYLNAQLGVQLAEPFRTAFTDVKTTVETEMTGISTTIQTGVTNIMTQFTSLTTSMSGIGIAFTNLGTQLVALGVQFVTFNTNVTALSTSFSTFNTGLLTVNTTLTAINVTATTLNTSLTTLNTSVTTIGQNLITANTNAVALNTTLTTLATSITTVNTNLVGLGTSLSAVSISLPTLNTNLMTLNTQLLTVNTTLTAFNSTLSVFGQGLNAIQAPITSLITSLTNLNTAFTNLQTTVQNAMTNIETTVTNTLRNIETAFTQAFDRIVQAAQRGMQDVERAVQQGMDRALRVVEQTVNRMVQALDDAVPKFRQAGANMGQALADGLNSKASTVEAAARRLANAAAAAMRAAAQIRSPSRVTWEIGEYIGQGLAEGMESSRFQVRKSARGLVNEVISASDSIAKAFTIDAWTSDLTSGIPSAVRQYSAYSGVVDHSVSGEVTGIAEAVETALSGWSVEIDSNGIAKMVNKSNTRRNRRR